MILFAAIKLPSGIAREVSRYQKGVSGARWSGPEKLHVTLGYFGEVDDDHAELLDEALAARSFSSFSLSLSGAGHFGKAEPHAIWMGTTPDAPLTQLHQHCRRAAREAGIIMEKRNYTPHVTLAYLRPFPALDRIIAFEKRLADVEIGPFLVDEFYLMSSHRKTRGANIYREEASYPLLG